MKQQDKSHTNKLHANPSIIIKNMQRQKYDSHHTITTNYRCRDRHHRHLKYCSNKRMNKLLINSCCLITLLIGITQLACLVEAGRLQEFFQNLVGNSVGLSTALASTLISSSSSNQNINNNLHPINHRNSIPSSINNNNKQRLHPNSKIKTNNNNNLLISQRTSVPLSKPQLVGSSVLNNGENLFKTSDLDTDSSNSQVSSILMADDNVANNQQQQLHDELTQSVMSPMMPAISPFIQYPSIYYRYASESFAPVALPRYGGTSNSNNNNNKHNNKHNAIASENYQTYSNPVSAMSRMSPMIAMPTSTSNNNNININNNNENNNNIKHNNHVIQQRHSGNQQQNLQILTPISSVSFKNQSDFLNKWPINPTNRQSTSLNSPAALASSPLSSMFDVFGAASQYLMHFKPSSFNGQSGTLQIPILTSHIPQIIEQNQQNQQLLTPIRHSISQQQQQHRNSNIISVNPDKKSSSNGDNNSNHNDAISIQHSFGNQNNNFLLNDNSYIVGANESNNANNGHSTSLYPISSSSNFANPIATNGPITSGFNTNLPNNNNNKINPVNPTQQSPSSFPVVHFTTSNYTKSVASANNINNNHHYNQKLPLAHLHHPMITQQHNSHSVQYQNNSTTSSQQQQQSASTPTLVASSPTSTSSSSASQSTTSAGPLALATSATSQPSFFSRLVSSSLGLMSGQSSSSSSSFQRREDVCGRTIQTPERRIIGGEGARYGEFPYQVHIKIAKHQCGGALVDRQSIVTAAHCVYHFITRAPVNKLQIVIGAYDIEDEQYQELPPQYFKVNKVKLHPNFRFSASHPDRYDVAILKLDKPVKYTDNVLPVCLPARDLNFESMVGTVTGFGKTDPSLSNRYGTRLLQKVDVPIIENSECERWHRTRGIDLKIFPEMMCAGYEDGLKDACVGDSGGPLVVKSASGPDGAFRWTLAGITSAGFGCAQSRQPGIYHRVSHTVDWILENLD